LALGYAELVQRVKELEAENETLRSLLARKPHISKVLARVTPQTPEAELFARQVPQGSVVEDVTPEGDNIPDALEAAAKALQQRRIPRGGDED
jgi:cystathionine beta-lyase/cystathionine gamma-synthase